MKKFISCLLCLFLFISGFCSFCSQTVSAASSYKYAISTVDEKYLAIHEEDSTESDTIATLSSGAVCRVLETNDEWTKVFSGGYTGYVVTAHLNFSQSLVSGAASSEGVSIDSDCNIYVTPSSSSAILVTRKKGATEYLAGTGGNVSGWTKVSVVINSSGDTMTGWVQNKNITKTQILKDAEPYFADWIKKEKEETQSSSSGSSSSSSGTSSASSSASPIQQYSSGTGVLTKNAGTVTGPSGKETYYNLDMSGVVRIMRNLGYSEEEYPYWIRSDGAKMLGDYIMVAANLSLRPRGTLVETSLGTGIVADTGDFAYSNATQLDLAMNW